MTIHSGLREIHVPNRVGGKGIDSATVGHCADCPVRQEGFCARLSEQTLKLLSERAVRVTVPAGQPLNGEKDSSEFGLVVSGYLRRVHYGSDGKRQVVNLTMRSEAYSLATEDHVGELEAATDVEICRIRTSSYRQTIRDCRDFRAQIFREAQSKMDRLHTQTCILAALSPERRIAVFLSEAIAVMPWQPLPDGGGILTIELTRTDIADYLGTTFESISRITQKFHRMGLIRIRNPYHFEIPDPEALSRYGGLVRPGLIPLQHRAGDETCPSQSQRMTVVNDAPRHGGIMHAG